MNGKGSAVRPMDMDTYRKNWERIFGVRVQDGATHWPGCWRVHPECRDLALDEASANAGSHT